MRSPWTVFLISTLAILSCGKSQEEARRELIDAVHQGDLKAVRAALEAGGDVHARDGRGASPLRIATSTGHAELVQLLLEAGAQVDESYENEQSAREIVLSQSHMEIIRLHLDAGMPVPAGSEPGWRALEAAAGKGRLEVVEKLIQAGLDVRVAPEKGGAALRAAAAQGRGQVVQALLEAGADVNAESQDGRTALWVATYHGHNETMRVLRANGADSQKVPGPLYNPQDEGMIQRAPDRYQVAFATSAGCFIVEVQRVLAPRGADRFYNLVKHGFYDQQRFFRVVPGLLVQFGIHGNPEVSAKWSHAAIEDDPPKGSNRRGTLSFAMSGPHSRTTQVFVNAGNNSHLDGMGFAPFGEVTEGMEGVDSIFAGYGEEPDQQQIERWGHEYLEKFPELDYIEVAWIAD